MKYTTIIGILLIGIGLVSSFMGKYDFTDFFGSRLFWLGALYAGGIGILLGGFLGWLYKRPKKSHSETLEKPLDKQE